MSAILLTMEPHHRYFANVTSEFMASPTRPFFLVVPAKGLITAVIPSISSTLYKTAAIGNIITWSAPRHGDDGVSELTTALSAALRTQSATMQKIGAELGHEMQLRMPVVDFLRIQTNLIHTAVFVDAGHVLKSIRSIKSENEIGLQREACQKQSQGFAHFSGLLRIGMTEREWCRLARSSILEAGVDAVPYMSCSSGAGGYNNIVEHSTDRMLQEGDIIGMDVGSTVNGHFCDFNRNWVVGKDIPKDLAELHDSLWRAIEAAMRVAKPGATTGDVFAAMLGELPASASGSSVGRMGHAVGLSLTEWPSLMHSSAGQDVTLEAGMIFALEPSASLPDGRMLVHEENIVIRENGAELLSVRGPRGMPYLSFSDILGEL
eukprot:TRINITY_DN76321_c0_g1_i1.p1 TRINITY_DN76321_c0_g1~~TRINITY_DN76321_c0_g1_i1.p1  ORF type:complete len:436 (+),score=66.52 TRINITY_DN76321_c0_g1_i1:179-1309(+)